MNKDIVLGWTIIIGAAFGGYKFGKKVGIAKGEISAYTDCRDSLLKIIESVENVEYKCVEKEEA